jgi:hypothetical protein
MQACQGCSPALRCQPADCCVCLSASLPAPARLQSTSGTGEMSERWDYNVLTPQASAAADG